jgi:hypothetical protein
VRSAGKSQGAASTLDGHVASRVRPRDSHLTNRLPVPLGMTSQSRAYSHRTARVACFEKRAFRETPRPVWHAVGDFTVLLVPPARRQLLLRRGRSSCRRSPPIHRYAHLGIRGGSPALPSGPRMVARSGVDAP